jgi:2,3,4,5-tetrahydropyridine-2-carboxylate N-succinyltransferase
VSDLAAGISALFSEGPGADRTAARAAFTELRDALDAGLVRSAEPDTSSPTGWRVNTWVKQGILLGFRFGDTVDMSADHGKWPFYDKDTMLLKKPGVASGVRIVPGGSTIRQGAFVAKSVVCMPPMYVNIGAYIDEGSLVDSHALVGSCAQIGKRVHISAVLAAGVVLTGSTPVYDLPRSTIIKPEPGQPLVVPEGAVVVPGARSVSVGAGREWGLSLATPVIVKYRDDRTDTRTELEAWIR